MTTTLTVTLTAARAIGACRGGRDWAEGWIAAHEGADADTPVPLADVLDSPGGMSWVVWCLPIAEPEAGRNRIARLWACDCAERVLALANDPRSAVAIEVARRYAVGEATDEELDAAWAAAWDAAWAAAWDAETEWQVARLRLYITGAELPPVEPIQPRKAEAGSA